MPPNSVSSAAPDCTSSHIETRGEGHLPLHVQTQLEAPISFHSDSNSECTDPLLKYTVGRCHPSDDHDDDSADDGCGYGYADTEDSDDEDLNSPGSRQKLPRKKSRRRKKKRLSSTAPPPMEVPIPVRTESLNGKADGEGHELSYTPDRDNGSISPTSLRTPKSYSNRMDVVRVSAMEENSDRNENEKPPVRTVVQRYNAWDSSPSTVADEDENNISFDMYFSPINDHIIEDDPVNVKKHLFSEDSADKIKHDIIGPIPQYDELSDNSDLELTQRSRQIQIDLRLQEMSELAVEAERAAEAGEEKFVGSATRFELGLGLDVGNERTPIRSSPSTLAHRSWSACDTQQSKLPDYDAVTPLRGYGYANQNSNSNTNTPLRSSTELKKPRPVSTRSRQVSAPSMLQSKKVAISAIPSILTSATFLSVAPPTSEAKEKIPVLALRHIEEVIPSFKEMHPLIKTNLTRCGVQVAKVNHQDVPELERNPKQEQDIDNPVSMTKVRSLTTPSAFMHRVPSFQVIMKSMSGLSVSKSSRSRSIKNSKSDDEISYDVRADADSDCFNEHDDMGLDCVSFVSCGDISNDVIATPQKKTKVSFDDVKSSNDAAESSDMDIYACTLATELHDPRKKRRSVSPLPKAPYSTDSDENLKITPLKVLASPRSRWSAFWENLSPAKRNMPMRSPLALHMNNTWSNSIARKNDALTAKTIPQRAVSNNAVEHLECFPAKTIPQRAVSDNAVENLDYLKHPLGDIISAHSSWEVQKDEGSNDVIISSHSFSEKIECSHSPPWPDDSCETCNPSGNVQTRSNIINAPVQAFGGKKKNLGNPVKTSYEKGSFRTSITDQMTCDGSQSSICSKDSETSQPSQAISMKSGVTAPRVLTLRPYDTACISNLSSSGVDSKQIQQSPKEEDINTNTVKPPLHPTVPSETLGGFITTYDSVLNDGSQALPTIEASISCPEYSDASSVLSPSSRDQNLNESFSKQGEEESRISAFNATCACDSVSTLLETTQLKEEVENSMSYEHTMFHPLGMKMSNISKENDFDDTGLRPQPLMNSENRMLPTIEASVSCPDYSISSAGLSDPPGEQYLSSTKNDSFTNRDDDDVLLVIGNENTNEATMQSLRSLWRRGANDSHDNKSEILSDNESKSVNDENAAISYDVLVDDTSVASEEDENNKSGISFIGLIEKVPSVLNRLRSFKSTPNKPESTYQDDIAFVENFFFTGIKPKEDGRTKVDDEPQHNRIFGKDSCLDLNCVSVMESALTYLSAEPPKKNSTYKRQNYPSEDAGKYGRLDNNIREKKVAVGGRLFKTPSLMDSKPSLIQHKVFDDSLEAVGVEGS